jgi:molecular chaperone GrpE
MKPKKPRERENESGGPIPAPAEVKSTEAPEAALAAEKERAAEYLANWQRAQADFINYKRRTEQERADFNSFANANLLLSLLPALDDLERALSAVPDDISESEWVEGIRLVERKFNTILEGQGVTPMTSLGEAFDPNFHEAMRQDKGPEGIILEEFQKGYLLGDKVLRPAKVVVGNGEEEAKEEPDNG